LEIFFMFRSFASLTLLFVLVLAGCDNGNSRFFNNSPNDPEARFTSNPVTTANVDELYSYQAVTDGASPSFFLPVGPAGMAINQNSGLITWTPNVSQLGDNTVQIRCQFPNNFQIFQSFIIVVSPANTTTTLSFSPASGTTIVGGSGTLFITATGTPSGGVFSLSNASSGATGGVFSAINVAAGTFSFSGALTAGVASVDVLYTSPAGNPVVSTYLINVLPSASALAVFTTFCASVPDPGISTNTVTVAGGPTNISDLNVVLDLSHTFTGDLIVALTSPVGTTVELTSSNGGATTDLYSPVVFDDQATDSITSISTAGGTFVPEESLATVNGEDANGTWVISVTDTTAGDSGRLNSLELLFDGAASTGSVFNCDTAPFSTFSSPAAFITNGTPVVDTITVTTPLTVGDLDVTLDITHTFTGDLTVTLTSPTGTVVTLTQGNGGSADNLYSSVIFDDNSTTPIANITNAGGRFAPTQALSAFNGQTGVGVWTLTVTDTAGGDDGTLNSWCLAFNGAVVPEIPANQLVPPSGSSFTIGSPALTITAVGVPPGGTFSTSNANDGGTGGAFGAINPTTGVFSFSGASTPGSASIDLIYTPAGGLPSYRTTYILNVVDTSTPLLVCQSPAGVIPDNGFIDFLSTVTGGPTSISDLNVFLDLLHSFTGDLDVTLTSPAGTVVELTSDNGGSADNLYDGILLDDSAPNSITTITTPGGTFSPEGILANFNGENANGTWTLRVTDDAGVDQGCLAAWCLAFDGVAVVDPGATCTVPVPFSISRTPGLTINDNATVVDAVTVAGGPSAISDLDVVLDIQHTFPGDLNITLTSPVGSVLDLTSGNGGGTDNLYSTVTLDDEGGTSVTLITMAGGRFQPEELLSTVDGENSNGVWTLSVSDTASGDTGCLRAWSLIFDNDASFVAPTPVNCTVPVPLLACNSSPAQIPDNSSLDVFIAVTGGPTSITDLNVFLNLRHTFTSDLDVFLISPASTSVSLATDVGGGSDDLFAPVTFDDSATNAISTITSAGGIFRPANPLNLFNGEDSNGTWTLAITDDTAGDNGCIASVCLAFDSATLTNPGSTCTPSGGGTTVSSGSLNVDFGSAGGSGDPVTITSNLTVTGVTDPITEVRVLVDIFHSFISDVDVSLTSPATTVVPLANNHGGFGANMRVIFDGTGAPLVTFDGSGPGTSFETFAPSPGSLTSFNGQNANGVWTLSVTDQFNSADNGTLRSWSLAINGDTSGF
jgi:subtilisin-like proprotein convertase family protein